MADLSHMEHHIGASGGSREVELADLAARQHGVVSRSQLFALGFGRGAIRARLGTARLHPVEHAVYALGHRRLSPEGRLMAALLACGPGAVLSHRSAGQVWGIRPTSSRAIDVTVTASRRSRGDTTIHRVRRLDPRDVTTRAGFPVTTLARTLLDLAEVADRQGLAKAFDRAEQAGLLDLAEVEEVCRRSSGRRGLRPLAALLVVLHGFEVDALWEEQRLVVELDGYEFHRSRAAFERDQARDLALEEEGYRVVRITWRRIVWEPEAVAASLRRLLGR